MNRICRAIMEKAKLLATVQANTATINARLSSLQAQLDASPEQIKQRVAQEKKQLAAENDALKKEIDTLVSKLVQLEVQNGVKQVPVEIRASTAPPAPAKAAAAPAVKKEAVAAAPVASAPVDGAAAAQGKKEKTPKKPKEATKPAGDEDTRIDVSRLDLRVGRIVSAKKHPDADSLYVEEVDLGEERNRTVVSGLVKFVPIEEMQNRLALLMCNLKPAKMRGVLSEAMVMCASTPEKVEILLVPENAVPGERVAVDGFPGEPDAQLNPKKKIWEQVAPDLKTNADGVATYKGSVISIPGKGVVKAPSLANVQIK